MRDKPKVLRDITTRRENVFRARASVVNLHITKQRKVHITRFLKVGFVSIALLMFVLGNVVAPTAQTFAANTNEEERVALEAELRRLESQIGEYQSQITSYQKQGGTLKNEISKLNAQVSKINLQMKAVGLQLSELNIKIAETQSKVRGIETDIVGKRESLGGILKNLYENGQASIVEVFLRSPSFSDFFSDVNNLTVLQESLQAEIREISDLKDRLEEEKEQLTLARADAETIRKYQETQRKQTEGLKSEKNNLLTITKGQESKFQVLLKQTKETAAQIRNRIFQLFGGGELTFESAYELAKIAGSATGVRPAFILAVLHRESALGQNVGRCSYTTAMNPKPKKQSDGSMKSDVDVFLAILDRLGIKNPESILVSCPNADGAYGGAMGPAQFIPSTWEMFKNAVSRITGNLPSNPWNNSDAFAAAALYLEDAGADVNERNAAAKYYCGSRWNRYVCTNVYGQRVVEQAAKFQADIDTILN